MIIVQNCVENCDNESLLIMAAPITSSIGYQEKFDILLYPDLPDKPRDGVLRECMVQLQLMQPILKADLYKKVGEISIGKKEEIMALMLNIIGLDLQSF